MVQPVRTLPHSLNLEASILGGILLRPSLLSEMRELDDLETDAFYDNRHKVVFVAMRDLVAKGAPIDVVTLENEIERQGKLDAVGGIAFLGELALRVPTTENVAAYTAIVMAKYAARRLALVASDLVQRVQAWDEDDAGEIIGEALTAIAALDRARPDDVETIGQLLKKRARELEDAAAARERGETLMLGVPTGIAELDSFLGGYPLGVVTLLVGRPAMGKSSVTQAAADATAHAGHGVHVFSQEDSWRMIADKFIARHSKIGGAPESGIGVSRLRKGNVTAEDARGIATALARATALPHWLIDARAGLTADEIIRSVRRHAKKNKTKLVIVDYWQIMGRRRGVPEHEALDENITKLSHAAKTDDIAYVLASQLNRDVEKRDDKHPQLSDIRGSGAGEERAKVVIAPYRGSYYSQLPVHGSDCDCNPDVAPAHKPGCPFDVDVDGLDESRARAARIARYAETMQMLILKDNNGREGRVYANWRGRTTECW
jgi:replicative DNA helicase